MEDKSYGNRIEKKRQFILLTKYFISVINELQLDLYQMTVRTKYDCFALAQHLNQNNKSLIKTKNNKNKKKRKKHGKKSCPRLTCFRQHRLVVGVRP